jgi:sugar-specific transcriptional regulator TrmB
MFRKAKECFEQVDDMIQRAEELHIVSEENFRRSIRKSIRRSIRRSIFRRSIRRSISEIFVRDVSEGFGLLSFDATSTIDDRRDELIQTYIQPLQGGGGKIRQPHFLKTIKKKSCFLKKIANVE